MSRELRNRVLITLTLLVLVQLIYYIPIPGFNLKNIFGFIYEKTGDTNLQRLKQFSISSLGLLPYFAASMLVMTIFYLLHFKKGLNEHKYPLHRYIIIVTIAWIILQSISLIRHYEDIDLATRGANIIATPGFLFKISVVISLLGGTFILIWIAHLITSYGIGNGFVVIIGLGLLNRWIPAFLEIMKIIRQSFASKFMPLFIIFDLVILIFIIVLLMLANWTYEIKLSNAQQPDRSFLLKFPLLLVGVFPVFFLPNFKLIFRLFGVNWLAHSPALIAFQAIFIIFLAFIFVLIIYQPKRLHLIKSRFLPGSDTASILGFDKRLIRILIIYAVLMLATWGSSLMLQSWLKDDLNMVDLLSISRLVHLFIIVAIIIDVYYQIKAHWQMNKFYLVSDRDSEPLFCETCGATVTVATQQCRFCGTNYSDEAKCVHHPQKEAECRCVVCSELLCADCAAKIRGSYRCQEHRSFEVRDGWTKIHVATTFAEAHILEEYLKGNGIEAKIFSNVMGSNYGAIKLWQLTPVIPFMVARWLGGGEIKILVPAEDFSKGMNLVQHR